MRLPFQHDAFHAENCLQSTAMSFATDTLALAQAAYQKALAGQTVQFGERRFSPHQIDLLRKEVQYWETRVAEENAASSGNARRAPMRFHL